MDTIIGKTLVTRNKSQTYSSSFSLVEENFAFLLRVDLDTVSHGTSKVSWLFSMAAVKAVSMSEGAARESAGEGMDKTGCSVGGAIGARGASGGELESLVTSS